MARAKKTETKKTTTKKATKKVVDDFPVDDMINDLKGSLITENSEQIGYKKKPRAKTKPKPIETVVEENNNFETELLEKSVNTDGNIDAVETVNVDEIVKATTEELKEEIEKEVVEEPVVEVKKEKESFLKKTRQIVTNHKWMGQIIDF